MMADAAATELEEQKDAQAVEVNGVELPEGQDQGSQGPSGQIDILLDTTVPISVTLGDAKLKAKNLLELGPGSVLRLDKAVGETMDLYLRGIKFARGHLVVVGESLGVRISEILPAENTPAEQPDQAEKAAEV